MVESTLILRIRLSLSHMSCHYHPDSALFAVDISENQMGLLGGLLIWLESLILLLLFSGLMHKCPL